MKIYYLLMAFLVTMVAFAGVTPEDVRASLDTVKPITNELHNLPTWSARFSWMISHWYLTLTLLYTIGSLLVRATPSQRDDKLLDKWVNRPIRFIGKVLTVDTSKDRQTKYTL